AKFLAIRSCRFNQSFLKNVRIPFQVDIGVGDVVIPEAEWRTLQTQLDGYTRPEVLTYSLESTVAEKLDSILQRLELTGRMKDFYDIYYLSKTFEFDGLKLQTAIHETLRNRATAYERDSFDRVAALANDPDMQTRWRYFLKSLGNPEPGFPNVVAAIDKFLHPVWNCMMNHNDFRCIWSATNGTWKSPPPPGKEALTRE
ncbi:MAG: nucleotidyl transferase AbiEii/AbiGii toxin family protein, partial [Oscillospiraceae bacterium]|nr:nucleotidyl transferase AbiEii/AbiGii toxin family protein [Oscillospiraceae bacterium]